MTVLFFLYLVNTTLLILHEMDSAYWKEWELFHLPGEIGGFLLLHFPIFILGLSGLVLVWEGKTAGLIFSLVISVAGIFAFCIHTYFLLKGHKAFNTVISKLILDALLGISIFQFMITISLL